MYPILYAPNETDFTTQGIGVLSECTKAFVTEELNGMFEFEFRYPQSGVHFSEIHHSSIVKVTPCENGTPQLFRVYRIQEPISGICVINCEHISYQLNFIPCNAFMASNAASALAGFVTNAWETCPFSFTTDKSTVAEYKQKVPEAIRARLGGQEGSILDVYGGEYEFDNYTVHLWNKRGSVRDVTLRYGKNITDIMQEENIEKTITGICPYWSQTSIDDNDQEVVTTVVLPEHVIHSEASQNFPFQRTAMVDFSSEWQEAPTVAQLRARAQQYIERNNIGVPSISIDISFVALWNTEEYKDIAPLERVRLGDTIGVYFEPLNISAEARIVKTVWNPLLERYDSVQVGDAKSTFAKSIIEDIPTDDDIDERIDERIPSVMDEINKEIEENSERITGGLGGYVKFTYNANGEPEEILIMNTDNVATAQYIIRMNRAGIGFSTHGYEGPYTSAWVFDTQNGVQRFNADFITAGTLTANIIRAGILRDLAGKNWWNMETGAFSFANGNMIYTAGGSYVDLLNNLSLRINEVPVTGMITRISVSNPQSGDNIGGTLIIHYANSISEIVGGIIQTPSNVTVCLSIWTSGTNPGFTIYGLPSFPAESFESSPAFASASSPALDVGTSYTVKSAVVNCVFCDGTSRTEQWVRDTYKPTGTGRIGILYINDMANNRVYNINMTYPAATELIKLL